MRISIKRSDVFKEFTKEEQLIHFDCKEDKVINNIDTFYYSCFLGDDFNGNAKVKLLLEDLDYLRNIIDTSNEKSLEFKNFQFVRRGFSIYKYCLSVENCFDVFISNYLPNQNTPRVVVQIRSIGLWLDGVEYCILNSYNEVATLLKEYGLEIVLTRENRIDYCYHTNSIQSPEKYFSDSILKKNCYSTFKNYQKIGTLTPNNLTIDYFALGSRSSNNVFIRMYNKSREVVEMNYKSMFFDIWFKHGLISSYDKFIYEYCFNAKSFEKVPHGMLSWYILNGKNEDMIFRCKELLKVYHDNPKKLKSFTDVHFPKLTLVWNIEFQTKRKFYSSADKMISMFPVFKQNNFEILPLTRLFQIVDNRGVFLKALTCDSVRFVKDSTKKVSLCDEPEYLRWWSYIRHSKVTQYDDNIKLVREYMKKLDIEKIKKDIVNKVSTLSVYINNSNSNSFEEDLSDFLSCYNDNDMECNKILFLEENTGEVLSLVEDEYYQLKKEKKYKSLKPLLHSNSPVLK